MLDENLRVLGRRINELEIELADRKEKVMNAEKAKKEAEERLGSVHDQQQRIRNQVEDELREEIEAKERESRKLREQLQSIEHRHKAEVEGLKIEKVQDLDLIENKVK